MLPVSSPAVLGAVLRETRTALRIPIGDMAAAVGVSHVAVRRLEQGKPTAAIKTLFHLLEELGLQLHVSIPPEAGSLSIPREVEEPRRTRVRP